ncbi:MAG: Clp protease N-terminal domain-containing protein [Caldilineaceae bacterium]
MADKLDRFSQRARRVLTLAQEEAIRLQQREIDTEHLLLGVLAETKGLAAQVLQELGCDRRTLIRRIEERTPGPQKTPWWSGKPTLGRGAKRAIELAVGVARTMGHKYIGTEHLLLGIVEEGEGTGAQVLQEFVLLEAIVHKITEVITGTTATEARQTSLGGYYAARSQAHREQEETEEAKMPVVWIESVRSALLATSMLRTWTTAQSQEEAIQEERNRLARDLHDSVKQQLFSISISAAAVRERLESDPAGALAALVDVQHSAQAAMVEIDALLHQLSPAPLATTGLVEALREQCEAIGYRTGAAVTTAFGALPPTEHLPAGTQEAIFRMAQEALSNVARHARATQIHLQLETIADENRIRLEIQDNGQGFDPSQSPKGMGLANLRARAVRIQGQVEIQSTPGAGTVVRIDIPLLEEPTPTAPSPQEQASEEPKGEGDDEQFTA